MPFHERIDVHSHFIPPSYRTACEETGHGKPDGMPAIPPWSEQAHIDLMKDLSITKSIISISSPGVNLIPGDHASSRKLARECNEFAGDLVRRRPQQFGFWAALPLLDVDGSLDEITYALDTLNAAGFAIETNYHGTYLGDPAFDTIFEALNQRKATVFIHPTTPCMKHADTQGHSAVKVLPRFPSPVFEFMFDTARAIINLFLSGTVARCPNITFVIPHAGGAMPTVIQRFSGFAPLLLGADLDLSSEVIKETFKKQFYFDLAGFPFPDQIWGILRFVGPEKLLYGSDYPFTPLRVIVALADKMGVGLEEMFPDEAVREKIYIGNAKGLLGDGN